MIEPKEIEIKGVKFIISKLPATVGREIISKYPISMIPKIGDYKVSEETMIKMMSYVQRIKEDGNPIALGNKALIDNHVPDWEVLAQLEFAMIEYNCSFFGNGKGLASLEKFISLAEPKITEMLTNLSGKLSHQVKQH